MRLGRIGYYADFFASFAAAGALFVVAMANDRSWAGRTEWLTWLLLGIGLWTILEYAIHRWVYHGLPFFTRLHNAHHEEPHAYIGAPPFLGILLMSLVVYVPVASWSAAAAGGLTAGMLLGYLAYQLVHHATHFWQPAPGTYLYRARLHHNVHHYHRQLGNFGITTSVWDKVFGTAVEANRRKSVMPDMPVEDT